MDCLECGAPLSEGAAFCDECGAEIEAPAPFPAGAVEESAAADGSLGRDSAERAGGELDQVMLLEFDAARRFYRSPDPDTAFQNRMQFRLRNLHTRAATAIQLAFESDRLFEDAEKGRRLRRFPELKPDALQTFNVPFSARFVGLAALRIVLEYSLGAERRSLVLEDPLTVTVEGHGPGRWDRDEQPVWDAVRLGAAKGGAPSDTQMFEMAPGLARAEQDRVKLVISGPDSVRKIFVFSGDRVSFGRAGEAPEGARQDMILRRLPCRKEYYETEDREAYAANGLISRGHGAFAWGEDGLLVEHIAVNNHTCVDDTTLKPGEMIRARDGSRIVIADKALELAAREIRPGGRFSPIVEMNWTNKRREFVEAKVGEEGRPRAFMLSRSAPMTCAGKTHTHEYLLLRGETAVGSAAEAGLRIQSAGVAALHAILGFGLGFFYVRPWPGENPPEISVSGRKLEGRQIAPICAGVEIEMGAARVSVERISVEDFKTLE